MSTATLPALPAQVKPARRAANQGTPLTGTMTRSEFIAFCDRQNGERRNRAQSEYRNYWLLAKTAVGLTGANLNDPRGYLIVSPSGAVYDLPNGETWQVGVWEAGRGFVAFAGSDVVKCPDHARLDRWNNRLNLLNASSHRVKTKHRQIRALLFVELGEYDPMTGDWSGADGDYDWIYAATARPDECNICGADENEGCNCDLNGGVD